MSSRPNGSRLAVAGVVSLREYTHSVNDALVLVLSADAMIAALLGALLEIHGFKPCYPEPNEHPREALRRCRAATALVDCDYELACSDGVLGPAKMTGARLILFSHRCTADEAREMIERYDAEFFQLPVQLPDFGRLLRGAEA